MKVAVEWVRSFGDFDDLTDVQLADTLTMAGLEVEEFHGSGPTAVFVTKVTPNRGDWMSIYGVAREAAAASLRPLNRPIPLSAIPLRESFSDFTVEVASPDLCPRYGATIVNDVQNLPSPQFIQDRLALAGMRPINAVVDITNYVMVEMGQPLHAFDLDTIVGRMIVVRRANDGEVLKTLDGIEHTLNSEILVIADAHKPIALAGIMGGAETEVTAGTRSIVLESAHFDPSAVRRAAKSLGITTEASYRFERFVDPALVQVAIARAVDLLVEYAGGKPLGAAIDRSALDLTPHQIHLRTARVNAVLGLNLSGSEVSESLIRLGLHVQKHEDDLEVFVPTFRPDLKAEIDLIEEVGRMIGYWNLPETVGARSGSPAGDFDKGRFDSTLRTILVGQGLVEAYSHTLGSVSPFDGPEGASRRVTVRLSLSTELSGLRLTLLPHLLDALALNLRHGSPTVRLFEVGKVFHKDGEGGFDEPRHAAAALAGASADYPTVKGIVENLFHSLGIVNVAFVPSLHHAMHPRRTADIVVHGSIIGYVAELLPSAASEHLELPPSTGRIAVFEIDVEHLRVICEKLAAKTYLPLPKFPSVTRDVALLYDLDTYFGDIVNVVRSEAGDLLEDVSLLSVYTGERIPAGKKSIALRLTLRSRSRTLTESDAEAATAGIRAALSAKLLAKER